MKSKIPTLLAIFLITAATASIVFSLSQFKLLRSSAETNTNPQDIKVTNLTDNSFTVTWITKSPTIGFVEYWSPERQNQHSIITTNSLTHLVTVDNLPPGSPFFFSINSNGQVFTNSNSPWSVQTLSSQIPNDTLVVSGTVLNESGFPAKDVLVFVDSGIQTFSTQVAASGNWILSIPQSETTLLQIFVEASTSSIALAKVDISNANPTPQITLGNSYDFRNQQSLTGKLENPKVEIQLP